MPQTFIPKLISLYQKGLFPFDKLVKKYEFAQINTAFADRESGHAISRAGWLVAEISKDSGKLKISHFRIKKVLSSPLGTISPLEQVTKG